MHVWSVARLIVLVWGRTAILERSTEPGAASSEDYVVVTFKADPRIAHRGDARLLLWGVTLLSWLPQQICQL